MIEQSQVQATAESVPAEQPLVQFREPLKVAYEVRTFQGPIGTVHGLYPLDGSPPRFYGEAVARAKPPGPFPEVLEPFRFDIPSATTPQEAFAQFERVCNEHAPAAKQKAAQAWYAQYRQMAGMQSRQPGIVDAMGTPIRRMR